MRYDTCEDWSDCSHRNDYDLDENGLINYKYDSFSPSNPMIKYRQNCIVDFYDEEDKQFQYSAIWYNEKFVGISYYENKTWEYCSE